MDVASPSMLGGPSDAKLVDLVLGGDLSAFEALIHRYQELVSAYTRHLLDNAFDAEDLSQEAFLVAYRELSRLRNPEQFASWLKSIAWRLCRNWVRKEQAARRGRALAQAEQAKKAEPGFGTPFDPDLEDPLQVEDPWLERLAQTIEQLGDGKKIVLALFYLDNLPHQQIANFLNIPLGTVKRRLHEARQAVAKSTAGADLDRAERLRFVEEVKRLLKKPKGEDS